MVSSWHELAILVAAYREQQMIPSHQSPDIDPRQIQQKKKYPIVYFYVQRATWNKDTNFSFQGNDMAIPTSLILWTSLYTGS